jgi:predicted Zn-dependent protease with MMP-like domain
VAEDESEQAEREEADGEESARFDELVEEALESLPAQFAARMENVDVVVEPWPSQQVRREMGLERDETLLGLYRGVPQTERSTSYGVATPFDMPMPDRIEIYREPILDEADATCPEGGDLEETVRQVIRTTVLHEVGHHFGLSDDDLERVDFD